MFIGEVVTLLCMPATEGGYVGYIEEKPSITAVGSSFQEVIDRLMLEWDLFGADKSQAKVAFRPVIKFRAHLSQHLN